MFEDLHGGCGHVVVEGVAQARSHELHAFSSDGFALGVEHEEAKPVTRSAPCNRKSRRAAGEFAAQSGTRAHTILQSGTGVPASGFVPPTILP
jgi:hypothetical protein